MKEQASIAFPTKRRLAALGFLCLGCIAPWIVWAAKSPDGIRYGSGHEVVLQGFHWNSSRLGAWYDMLQRMAPTIAQDGFTTIWMPPPWRDDSSWRDEKSGASGGGEGYFWRDFDKNSRYGSEAQLQQAAQALAAAKVTIVYDIVPNHRDRKYPMGQLPSDGQVWRNDCAPSSHGANACDDGDPFMGGDADLDLANPAVAEMFETELAVLRDRYHAGGFRFDYVRGYAPGHVQHWMTDTLDQGFCVGELWKAPSEYPADDPRHQGSWQDVLKGWSRDSGCTVFDFALKERMQNGSIDTWRYGLNGNPDARWREAAETFIENHDTGPSPPPPDQGQHHWALPEPRIKQAYSYILLSPGTPTVYWPHMYGGDLHDYLRLLIHVRRQAGVQADSAIQFREGYGGLLALVKGSQQSLVIALDTTLLDGAAIAGTTVTPVVNTTGGQAGSIRIWRTGPADPAVSVPFQCDQGITQPGNSVYVVGSAKELGAWDPARAVRLDDVSDYPRWKGHIALASSQAMDWKCIVRSEQDATHVERWQAGKNNELVVTEAASAKGSL